MSKEFKLSPNKYFVKKYQKLIAKNSSLVTKIKTVFDILEINPFENSLKTHKVKAKIDGPAFSSSITGDLRIIWNFDKNKIKVIDLLDIGGHEGKNSVY